MNRCAFVIPYFGKFNVYFQLFLDSCKANPDFDWLIFTDDRRPFAYPQNVRVEYTTFSDIAGKFQSQLDFKISLGKPYKLCDYKLMYGTVFADYLSAYEFWGFCDVDMIFGHIGTFITDAVFDSYDKIGFRGHLTLLRNNEICNHLFMTRQVGMSMDYRYAFTTAYTCHFDEHDMWTSVAKTLGIREWREECFADIDCNRYGFRLMYGVEKKARQLFEYKNGCLVRYYLKDNILERDEWLYIHLQKRRMRNAVTNTDSYLITPSAFIAEVPVSSELIGQYARSKPFYLWRRVRRAKEILVNIRNGALIYKICAAINQRKK